MIICQNCGNKIYLDDDEKNEDEDSDEVPVVEKPKEFSIIPIKEIECSFSEKDKLGGGKYGVVYKVKKFMKIVSLFIKICQIIFLKGNVKRY